MKTEAKYQAQNLSRYPYDMRIFSTASGGASLYAGQPESLQRLLELKCSLPPSTLYPEPD
jgi:hypothetical protein